MSKESDLVQNLCKIIGDTINDIAEKGELVSIAPQIGFLLEDSARGKFVKQIADVIVANQEVASKLDLPELQYIFWQALWGTRNAPNMQVRASRAAELARQELLKKI